MNNFIQTNILSTIKAYDRIIICRHKRPDGDAVGSSKGLQLILKASFPKKEILVINEDYSEYMAFLGPEDSQIKDELYASSLVIVLDTGNVERISNTKYCLANQILKIDHHIDMSPYGDISWVDDTKSSTCEMIVLLQQSLKDELILTKEAATCLYAGMVTDSGRFKYSETNGDTLRHAAILMDMGIDTQKLYAHLYLDSFDYLKFQAQVFDEIKLTENGVAHIFVSLEMKERFHLSEEEASNIISFLDGIKDSLIWLAFIENKDETLRVRLRSRFVTVNELAQKYGGGGHAFASGATIKDIQEMNNLISDADALLKTYKEQNTNWL